MTLFKYSDLFIHSWPLARIIQIHPGDDGLVRVAIVRTQKGVHRRAIHKLIPLLEQVSLSPVGRCSGSSPPHAEATSSSY